MIKPEGRGFNSHSGQSFPLSLCGPNSISRANAHMVYGLKHQHFTLHSITRFIINISHADIVTVNYEKNRLWWSSNQLMPSVVKKIGALPQFSLS